LLTYCKNHDANILAALCVLNGHPVLRRAPVFLSQRIKPEFLIHGFLQRIKPEQFLIHGFLQRIKPEFLIHGFFMFFPFLFFRTIDADLHRYEDRAIVRNRRATALHPKPAKRAMPASIAHVAFVSPYFRRT